MNKQYLIGMRRGTVLEVYDDAKACRQQNEEGSEILLEFYCAQFVSNIAMAWLLSDAKCEGINRDDVISLTTIFAKQMARDFLTNQWVRESIEHMINDANYMEVFEPVFRSTLAHDPLLTAARAAGGFDKVMNPPVKGHTMSELPPEVENAVNRAMEVENAVNLVMRIVEGMNRYSDEQKDAIRKFFENDYAGATKLLRCNTIVVEQCVEVIESNISEVTSTYAILVELLNSGCNDYNLLDEVKRVMSEKFTPVIFTEVTNEYWKSPASRMNDTKQEILVTLKNHGFKPTDAMSATIYLMNKFGRDAVCEAISFYPDDWTEVLSSVK